MQKQCYVVLSFITKSVEIQRAVILVLSSQQQAKHEEFNRIQQMATNNGNDTTKFKLHNLQMNFNDHDSRSHTCVKCTYCNAHIRTLLEYLIILI
jgi:phage terminase large subunit-like protein